MLYKFTDGTNSVDSSSWLRNVVLGGSKICTNSSILHVVRSCVALRTLLNHMFTCKPHHFWRPTFLEPTSLISGMSQTWQLCCILSLSLRVLILQLLWNIRAFSVGQVTVQISISVVELTTKIATMSLFINFFLNSYSVFYCRYWRRTWKLHHLIFNRRCPNHFRLKCWPETASNWLLTTGRFSLNCIPFSSRRHDKTVSIRIL